MGRIKAGQQDFSYCEPGRILADRRDSAHVAITDAAAEDVARVVEADPDDEHDGRSQWVWIRFPNGDLALATFPQGETYSDVEVGIAKAFESLT